ncbi:FecR family protein [Chitinophaga japonensis]|uniref:FecR family protein n=1 Tax=Chitinophaga japonensis TaxID=104662 RepID=A0A562TBX7_CHIJA|nr:FecR domain-containing protein [Chitinophaga japonensis]TWI91005.1 FecR family protein [Chitinophaga japonensis]
MLKKRFSTADLKAVLNRYIQGSASPEEAQQVERWYAGMSVAQEEDALADPGKKEQLRQEIVSGIMMQIQAEQPLLPARRRYWRPVAAAVLIMAAGACLYLLRQPAKVTPAARLVYAPPGARKTVTLADGSVVRLNAGTVLSIAGDYGQQERQVELRGEAFFEVAADPQHPFRIRAGEMITEVLGTSFNIKAYKEQKEWQVAVAGGSVKVLRQPANGAPRVLAAVLTANRELAYDLQTQQVAVRAISQDQLGAWRNNRFCFHNSTLAEIAAELQRQYNVPVVIAGKGTTDGHYKISFEQEPLPKVLKLLSDLTGITYTIQPDQVIIHTAKTH